MAQSNWKKVKVKLEKAIGQGLKALKTGSEEAWHVAEKTAHVLKTEAEAHGLKAQISKLNEQFGHEVHRSMKSGVVRITPLLRKINERIGRLEQLLRHKESVVRRTTIVARSATPKNAARRIRNKK